MSRSAGVGLFAGGAHLTTAVTYAPVSRRPSPAMHGRGLVREAGAVKRREQPVARPVAGEHAARAVAAVGGGREADHDHERARVAEAGQRPGPVALAAVAARRIGGDGLAPRDQPRAQAAGFDLGGEPGELARCWLAHATGRVRARPRAGARARGESAARRASGRRRCDRRSPTASGPRRSAGAGSAARAR